MSFLKSRRIFIHFAFSSLKDNPESQITSMKESILETKRLRYRKNPEFIPVFQSHIHPKFRGKKVVHIQPRSIRKTDFGAEIDYWKESNTPKHDIFFLRENVGMICFIETTLKQLRSSPHSVQYGRLGLVFSKDFLIKNGIRQVQYYQEKSLYNDPLVLKWNNEFAYRPYLSSEENKRKRDLEIQILAFRKPYRLFESFSESRSVMISQSKVEIKDAYDRYTIGYDFHKENEWRIVQQNNIEFIEFSERDLYMIVVPDIKSKNELEKYFVIKWNIKPTIFIFPGR